MKICLKGLDPREYQHPLDGRALDALKAVPGLDSVTATITKLVERTAIIQCTGSNLEITKENYPELLGYLDEVCEVLDLPSAPRLYVEWDDAINAHTVGSEQPIIVLSSGCVDRMEKDEIKFILGHECGHIKSRHQQYSLAANYAPRIGDVLGTFSLGVGNLLTTALQFALQKWNHCCEFTCDRAGMLACQNQDAVLSAFIKMSGLPEKFCNAVFHKSFLEQAKRFDSLDDDTISKAIKLATVSETHPWTVLRASEIIKWVEDGSAQSVFKRETARRKNVYEDGGNEFCRICKFRLDGRESFCPSCGANLET